MKNNFKLAIGMGDILIYKSMFQSVDYKINAYLEYDYYVYRGTEYKNFIDNFCDIIFNENVIFHKEKSDTAEFCEWNKPEKYGMKYTPIDLKKEFNCKNNKKDLYICLNMKVRGVDKNFYNNKKNEFIKLLQDLNKKYSIFFIGEKEIELNKEYEIHNKKNITIFSIYDDIIKFLDNKKNIDLTIDKCGITSPNLSKIIEDMNVVSNSLFTINIGYGGNIFLSSSVGKTINYYTMDIGLVNVLFPKSFNSNDFDIFIREIKKYV